MVFQNHNHIFLLRGQVLNLIHQKIQLIHRGYLVLVVIIGIEISGSVGLPDDPDSDSVESSSCQNLTSMRIIDISATLLDFIFWVEKIILHKE
jgi:hypothetical protein